MFIGVILVTALAMFLMQVAIFYQFPRVIRAIFCCVPLLAVIMNFILSGVILMFTGVGSTVGVANVLASVLFGFYLLAYRSTKGIDVRVKWGGWSVFRYPILQVTEGVRQ